MALQSALLPRRGDSRLGIKTLLLLEVAESKKTTIFHRY